MLRTSRIADWSTVDGLIDYPYTSAVVCARSGHGDMMDFVLTHDPDLVHTITRMLMWRLDRAAPWLHPAGGAPEV